MGGIPGCEGHFFRQGGQLCAEGLRDGESGDKAVRPDHGDGGVMQCKPAFEAVLRIAHPQRAGFINSLGLKRYLSAMQCAALVVGNSSSGVVETPTFGVPTVNIGSRQAGRIICQNVLCCAAAAPAIEAVLRRALTPEFSAVAHAAQSPYNGGDTSGKICRVLAQFDFAKPKTFYDGPVPEFNPKRSISL